jgi:PAS domain-containing protein
VIVATKAHLEALDLYLRQQNLVPELLRKRQQMYLAPAEVILEKLMPHGVIEAQVFFDYFGPLFEKLQATFPKLLVYGELVNILCEQGEHEQAHELEEVWEQFLAGKEASLLCGYDMNVFSSDGLEDVFERICRSHSIVQPAESIVTGTVRPEEYSMLLAMLQQKNLRLEVEVGRRIVVETALTQILEHLGLRSTDAIQTRDSEGSVTATNLLPVAIIAATTIDGITDYFYNTKFLRLTGLTKKTVTSDPGWLGAVHYQDRERVSRDIRLVDGKSRRLEYRFVLPEGTIKWVVGESVSRETGYVHTAVDITQLKVEPAANPSRTGSIASVPGGDPNLSREHPKGPAPSSSVPWSSKRAIDYRSTSSPITPSAPIGGSVRISSLLCCRNADISQTVFTHSRPNNPQIAQDLTRMTQLLWDNLFPEPSFDPTDNGNVASKLTVLYTWFRSLSRSFIPEDSAFDIQNDALQKANIRLSHISYLGSIILLSRHSLIRAIERGDYPNSQPSVTRHKSALDDRQYAVDCFNAAVNAITHIHSLITPISPSTSSTPPIAAFTDDHSLKDIRSSRTVVGVFFISTLIILLHLSVLRPHEMANHDSLMDKTTQIINDLRSLPETAEVANRYKAILQPFVAFVMQSQPAHQYPDYLYAQGQKVKEQLIGLLRMPQGGAEWVPYRDPRVWSWKDLLAAPGAIPVGGRMEGPIVGGRIVEEERIVEREGSGPPVRGDKRMRQETQVEDLYEPGNEGNVSNGSGSGGSSIPGASSPGAVKASERLGAGADITTRTRTRTKRTTG